METYDVIVIGAGPGGYEAALQLSEAGKKVLLVEKENLGGVCTNCGCIPTKSLLNSAKTYYHALNGENIGVKASDITFSIEDANNWKNDTIQTLRDSIAFQLKNSKTETVFGQAEVADAHTVKVNGTSYSCNDLILATGSSPFLPPIQGIDSPCVKTSTDLLNLDKVPSSITIIGGGVIGIEFASLFSMLGSTVTVVEMLDDILPMADSDITKIVKREMKNVTFNLGCKVSSIDTDIVNFVDLKQNLKQVKSEVILVATGRRANSDLAVTLGLEMNRNRTIKVDSTMKTSSDHVWAIGDVNGLSQLAHSASEMACVCVQNILGKHAEFAGSYIPWAVYSNPEVSGVGLTQKAAEEKGIEVKTASFMLRGNGRFLAENGKRAGGLIKVIASLQDGTILGIHMVGSYASEIVSCAGLIVSKKMTKDDVMSAVFPHPSVGEALKTAVSML